MAVVKEDCVHLCRVEGKALSVSVVLYKFCYVSLCMCVYMVVCMCVCDCLSVQISLTNTSLLQHDQVVYLCSQTTHYLSMLFTQLSTLSISL